MNENKNPVTAEELNAFVSALSKKVNDRSHQEFPLTAPNWTVVRVQRGAKYARLVQQSEDGEGQSAYGFVDLANGDILKAAGWNARAKGARGNIRQGDADNAWNGACGRYGVAYARGGNYSL